MSSSELSPQEAMACLHRLITESVKVQAAFKIPPVGMHGLLAGKLKIGPDKKLWVVSSDDPTASIVAFDPNRPAICKRGDAQVEKGSPDRKFYAAGITFTYADGSTFALLEVATDIEPRERAN